MLWSGGSFLYRPMDTPRACNAVGGGFLPQVTDTYACKSKRPIDPSHHRIQDPRRSAVSGNGISEWLNCKCKIKVLLFGDVKLIACVKDTIGPLWR